MGQNINGESLLPTRNNANSATQALLSRRSTCGRVWATIRPRANLRNIYTLGVLLVVLALILHQLANVTAELGGEGDALLQLVSENASMERRWLSAAQQHPTTTTTTTTTTTSGTKASASASPKHQSDTAPSQGLGANPAQAAQLALAPERMMTLRVGQYNILCPTYGVKWGEREACAGWSGVTKPQKDPESKVWPAWVDSESGKVWESNWESRWPALIRNIESAEWDILALEELDKIASVRGDVDSGLKKLSLRLEWFDHPGREDALGIAFNEKVLSFVGRAEHGQIATIGRVDLRHIASGRMVRVVVTHQKGPPNNEQQWADTLKFLFDDSESDTRDFTFVLCGDMNEDFNLKHVIPSWVKFRELRTLNRNEDRRVIMPSQKDGIYGDGFADDEFQVSRPPHKQGEDQTSGKGKVDYVFVRAPKDSVLTLERDEASKRAMRVSHTPVEGSVYWASDHDIEAFSLTVS